MTSNSCKLNELALVSTSNMAPLNLKEFSDDRKLLWFMLDKLHSWAVSSDFETYDWWDIWGTKFGQWAKGGYLAKRPFAYAGVASLIALDLLVPGFRRAFTDKRSFPICHAQFALGYLNLWKLTKSESFLQSAIGLVKPLIDMASPATTGLGWGMKHEWMTVQGLIPADTPCNTQTAYAYDLFAGLLDATGEDRYKEYLLRIAQHVATEFPETVAGGLLSCSYSTIDNRRVINSNSYRMHMLVDAGIRFGNAIWLEKGKATARYVIAMQSADGSWPYSEDQGFVDNFHTVFVLKNLLRIKTVINDLSLGIDEAVRKGLSFFVTHLIDSHGRPKPFSTPPRSVLYRFDSYDLAETIGFFSEFSIETDRIQPLLEFAAGAFQTRAGWFAFRLYRFWPFVGIPYMRYANSAMFLSLTKAALHQSGGRQSNQRS